MAIPVQFPSLLMREQASRWRLVASVASPGLSGSGAFPLLRLDGGGLWMCELDSIPLFTKDQVRTWRAVEQLCDGGANPIIVPMCDKRHMPAPLVGGVPVYASDPIPHSDDTFFSDGSGYSQSVVLGTVYGDYDLRATQLVLALTAGEELRGGEYFSIKHPTESWRLYLISAVEDDDYGSLVTIRPPLREEVTDGTSIHFDKPRCVMRLASPDAMNLTLELRRHGRPSAAFVEHLGTL